MKQIHRYILLEFMGPMVLSMLVFTFILMTKKADDLFMLLNLEDVSWGLIFKVLILLFPFLLTMSLPMGILIACLTSFSRLSADRELLIIRASGINPWKVIQPLLYTGTLCTLIVFYCTTSLVPWTYTEFRKVMYDVVVQLAEHLKEKSFNRFGNDLIVYVNHAEDKPGNYQGVTLFYTKNNNVDQILTARRGQINLDPDQTKAILSLEDGTFYKSDLKDPSHFYLGTFESWSSENDMARYLKDPEQGPKKRREYTIQELKNLINEKQNKFGYLYRVELNERYAIPFSCLVFVLVGTSLGSIWRIRNRTLGFFLGVILIGAYWVMLVLGENLGIKGKIIPELSPWLPNIILGGLGLFLTWRVCRQ